MKKTTLLLGAAVVLVFGFSGCVYNCIPQPATPPPAATEAPALKKAQPEKTDSKVKESKESQEKLEPVTDEMRRNNEINFNQHYFVGFEMPSWMYSLTWDKLI
ncbi:hypothetical protein P0136_10480 [Lentisphaerota bacterium ZTH]|nr:hypothetical protein JYG24_12010 [Lentisphaerota bacterium]WET05787.1 hypothetical protein P0136_10480 [Lentisphaerota bacterium ZTH]